VVSRSGRLDHPALRQGGVLLAGDLSSREIVQRIRADGHQRILCEGGPGLFTWLISAGLVDEIFLTLSPRLFGRFAGDGRKALTDGRDLQGKPLQLRSLRRLAPLPALRDGEVLMGRGARRQRRRAQCLCLWCASETCGCSCSVGAW